MTIWRAEAPAKVNLFLRVLAREEGGYHQIETLFQALELSDRIRLELREGGGVELTVTGVASDGLGPPEENLVVRAARAFLEAAFPRDPSPPGVGIHLEKRIPHGAGLGGGSSDAATVLRGMTALMPGRLDPPTLLRLGGALGADVGFFLAGGPLALGWGRGDRLLPLPPLPAREVLLALPPAGISTPWAYQLLARARQTSGSGWPGARRLDPALFSPAAEGRWDRVAELAENDFQAALAGERPELEEVLQDLREVGARPALLSGSGSALFGVFASAAEAEKAEVALERTAGKAPDLRLIRTRTVGGS